MLTAASQVDGPFEQPSDAPEEPQCWPMSSAQLRIWFVEQLTQGTSANNLHFGLRLTGELDTAALGLSLRVVVDRHEALRTTFDIRNGEPVQLIHCTRPAIEIIDLSGRSASEAREEAYAVARREVYTPFDLRKGPLVRLVLLRLGPDSHVMLAVLHHIICDNWSLGLFARELETCYTALCDGTKPGLKTAPLHYADYVGWEREWLGSEDFEHQLSYWTGKLAGARLTLDLSAGSIRPSKQSLAGSSQTRGLSSDVVEQLKAVATNHHATPFAVLLSVFQIMLFQYSGEPDILVGIPVSGRSSVELEEVIGNFTNLVVVRTDLSGDRPFSTLLRVVRDTILDALSNQTIPFERLVEALHPSRHLVENPIFQVLFASVTAAAPRDSFGGLLASPYIVEAIGSPFDLSMSIIEDSPDVWWLRAEYRSDLFTDNRIASLLDHYVQLLRSVVAGPQVRLSHLDRPSNWPITRGAGNRLCRSSCRDAPPNLVGALPEPEHTARATLPQCRPLAGGQSSDNIEQTLEGLWVKVLGTRPPGIATNFFDLGGHSLMAVRLISEISRVFRRNLPVSFVFEEPTIAAMARHLRGQVRPPSSVVPLHEGGPRSPFFCSGQARREFQQLSDALGCEQPFFHMDTLGLQEQRHFAGEPLYRSVPDIAASFRQELLSIQPRGPYFLGGLCDGGIIAFEIALQLQEQGHQVGLLAQFDTPLMGYWRRRPIHRLQHWHWRISSGNLPSKIRNRFAALWRRRFPATLEEKRFFHIQRVLWQAIGAYRPGRAFEGEIQFFHARNPPTWFVEDTATGWDARASQGVRIHELASEHTAIFHDPPSQRVIVGVIEQAYRQSVNR
jgi:thioesterase domain-containing protein